MRYTFRSIEETAQGSRSADGLRLQKAVAENTRKCYVTASFLITAHLDFGVLLGALLPKGDRTGVIDVSHNSPACSRALVRLFEDWVSVVKTSMHRVDCSVRTGDPLLITGLTTKDGLDQRWSLIRKSLLQGDNYYVRGLCEELLTRGENRFLTTNTGRHEDFLKGSTATIFWRILDLHFRSQLNATSQCHLDYLELSPSFRRQMRAFAELHPFFATASMGSLESGMKVYNPVGWKEEMIHQRERREKQGGRRR